MHWEPISDQDRKIIAKQINREPRNLCGVARRCPQQCPQVSVNYPLPQTEKDANFFPTVFWLTCPEAVRRIGGIEDRGFIQHIQVQINANKRLSEIIQAAHEEYAYIRRAMLGPDLKAKMRAGAEQPVQQINKVGIGGVGDLKGIKCLHMHYAHYLATRNNPIGELVDKMLKLSGKKWQCNQCRQHADTQPAGVAE
ncbi:DUF501 domain-containing protein [candidate division FCPU426 bacterium]|nr:DUF501 domain-containing protein [candidate division FCPU426 bacterium]